MAIQESTLGGQLDNWSCRVERMRCRTCRFFVAKQVTYVPQPDESWGSAPGVPMPGPVPTPTPTPNGVVGRCRRHAPTLRGWPVVYDSDWCGDHKLDETKV